MGQWINGVMEGSTRGGCTRVKILRRKPEEGSLPSSMCWSIAGPVHSTQS